VQVGHGVTARRDARLADMQPKLLRSTGKKSRKTPNRFRGAPIYDIASIRLPTRTPGRSWQLSVADPSGIFFHG
jgi:hypothetical protein